MGNRLQYLQNAVGILAYRLGKVQRCSPVYETPSWGFKGEPFYNVCVAIDSTHSPTKTLTIILEIEQFLGRERKENQEEYLPRPIDIDLLLYKQEVIHHTSLTVPHPRMQDRNFVLQPLADIAPDVIHPVLQQDCSTLLKNCTDASSLKPTEHKLQCPTPYDYIAIEGLIGAGKTAFARLLCEGLGGSLLLETFEDNPYLADFYRDPDAYALDVEKHFLKQRKSQQETFFSSDPKKPVVADYTLEKSLLFAQMNLSKKEANLYALAHGEANALLPEPSLVLYLEVSVDRAEANVRLRARNIEQELKKDYLYTLDKAYANWKQNTSLNLYTLLATDKDFVRYKEDFLTLLYAFFTHRF